MEIKLKTLTPIWTGGVEAGKMDRIHETGIIGSLRWWYEVIVRGLGGEVCDPTKHKCRFDPEKYRKSEAVVRRQRLLEAGVCDACQVFGTTGWQRRFRLVVEESSLSNVPLSNIQAERQHEKNGKQKTPSWYFKNSAISGDFIIQVHSLDTEFQPAIISGLLQFVAGWAALGARPQMGFGVVKLDSEVKTDPFLDYISAAAGQQSYPALPSLKNSFFCQLEVDNATAQKTFNIKYDLRRLFKNDKNLRHFIMGTVKGKRMGAKVRVSRPYGGTIRVWGWIPEKANVYNSAWNREKIMNAIHAHLHTNYHMKTWREMSSRRDTITVNNNDVRDFILSLLSSQEATNAA